MTHIFAIDFNESLDYDPYNSGYRERVNFDTIEHLQTDIRMNLRFLISKFAQALDRTGIVLIAMAKLK